MLLPPAKELLEELEKRLPYYEFNNGDVVYIGIDEYEIRSINDNIVELADAFDPQNDGWSEEYKELKSLLTEKEYSEARQSTLTAFYTPPVVISSIYKALEKMGLEKGNILEPSCRSW